METAIPLSPFAKLLGISIKEMGEGKATFSLETTEKLLNSAGTQTSKKIAPDGQARVNPLKFFIQYCRIRKNHYSDADSVCNPLKSLRPMVHAKTFYETINI